MPYREGTKHVHKYSARDKRNKNKQTNKYKWENKTKKCMAYGTAMIYLTWPPSPSTDCNSRHSSIVCAKSIWHNGTFTSPIWSCFENRSKSKIANTSVLFIASAYGRFYWKWSEKKTWDEKMEKDRENKMKSNQINTNLHSFINYAWNVEYNDGALV